MRLIRLRLTNFLSYRDASLEFGDFVALVGPNASGKSNAIAAIKLLRDIVTYGLPTAMARRGGFDQLRHRSEGRPYDPAIALDFSLADGCKPSVYELKLRSLPQKLYTVKTERAELYWPQGQSSFLHTKGGLQGTSRWRTPASGEWQEMGNREPVPIPPGHSALQFAFPYDSHLLWQGLRKIQFVETNPTQLRAFQEPSSGYELEPTGSNAASFFEGLSESHRQELIDNLAAVVPGICDVGARKFSNRVTIAFYQLVNSRRREFLANQMSDGTLRAFAILLAILQDHRPDIVIIEEPEVAIHLGALRVLVDILQAHSREIQMAITTHSADIVDSLNVDDLRVIWSEDGASHLARVAAHTRATVREGLVSSGDLLRADALDPAVS